MTTAPMVDYKIHWLKMMSVPESRAVVGRHDGINGRDSPSRYVGHPLPGIRLPEVRAGIGSDENRGPEDDPATRETLARAELDALRAARYRT